MGPGNTTKDYAHFSIRGTVEALTYTPKSCRITVVAQEPGTGNGSSTRTRYYRNHLVTFDPALMRKIRQEFGIGDRAFFSGTVRTESNRQERTRAGKAVMVVHYAARMDAPVEPVVGEARAPELPELSAVQNEERDRARLEIICQTLQEHAWNSGLIMTADNLPGLVMTAYELMTNYTYRQNCFSATVDEQLLRHELCETSPHGQEVVRFINGWPAQMSKA